MSSTAPMAGCDDLAVLQAENARLIALLEAHAIEWRLPPAPATTPLPVEQSRLSPNEKVALFRRLFRGRTDVYPIRWESKTTGKSGYSPACANEWRSGVCEKPRIKCGDCGNRLLIPLSDAVIYSHLAGDHTIGIYPLLDDDTCYFLAVDFDDAQWRDDAHAFMRSCKELGVSAALEISRSGQGAHAWIFFSSKVPARDARRLGTAIISHTCSRTRQLKLTSYDRLFPNQDTMPKGGFGNLIALPLQKWPREKGCSVFVDADLRPCPDQWAFLAAIQPVSTHDIEPIILRAADGIHPLDVTFIDDEDMATPWKRGSASPQKLSGVMPTSLTVTLANLIYFEKAQLPQALANRLIRLAAFQNPEFYKAQAMRMSVWDKPRVIGSAENYPQHIALPRGCLDAALSLLRDNGIACELRDERFSGDPANVTFAGTLRLDQEAAVSAMLQYNTGVLCAPTAFGKTVMAAAMIARRGVNTLILVHRTELLKQWQERLQAFLGTGKDVVGTIGGGKPKPTGRIDIAVMQSLSRQGEVNPLIENYGQVIVDECHHVGAVSFDAILKRTKAKYVLGLTATPIRRDGQQPIIFMQCGPIRYTAAKPAGAPHDLEVVPRSRISHIDLPPEAGIQDVFRHLANDQSRTDAIATEVRDAFQQGRKVLVLTERTEHLAAILAALGGQAPAPLVLHGRMSKKQRATLIAELDALPPEAPRILLATGRLVGEGFDHPPLDTLVLAMPVSWKGTLQQYAGRLHREHTSKTEVRIVDFIDTGHPALLRMWDKRQRGYRAMGYRVGNEVGDRDV
ncbi:DEAD/DEAH box helicase family protein [Xanthomonas phaseoli pv. dieffenbachiae]|uniref:TOTE conflict system archaeo-eukaryotic primase domain-containing protein n=1 Tax=Xanthomonas TaxID=338 RepID=UPI001AD9546D|nr:MULTISPECIES: DEAD/DEAH box helicase family protein [Xanthomonas]MBO9745968.1 DEAD/DEAH box helicase family protein [Xanthomonas phaseoli pv. dieffenbachiae]MBO9751803.1 DEAD/DEAH box helicase family protein [Xanthomonas phaseoli pv. dieffenbachiae]MBO9888945.1 DEAD/DEAH box helicase family protein [Xanthomonas sp. D-36-1]